MKGLQWKGGRDCSGRSLVCMSTANAWAVVEYVHLWWSSAKGYLLHPCTCPTLLVVGFPLLHCLAPRWARWCNTVSTWTSARSPASPRCVPNMSCVWWGGITHVCLCVHVYMCACRVYVYMVCVCAHVCVLGPFNSCSMHDWYRLIELLYGLHWWTSVLHCLCVPYSWQGPAAWYKLYAVLVHSGFSCHSGHYYCFVRNSNNFWYCMNDSAVSFHLHSRELHIFMWCIAHEVVSDITAEVHTGCA